MERSFMGEACPGVPASVNNAPKYMRLTLTSAAAASHTLQGRDVPIMSIEPPALVLLCPVPDILLREDECAERAELGTSLLREVVADHRELRRRAPYATALLYTSLRPSPWL